MKRGPSPEAWKHALSLSSGGDDDFRPAASLSMLRRRAELLRQVRGFFDGQGFFEVETPLLSADTVVDRHLDPFAAGIPRGPGVPPRRMWLQTSPEFAMKRLLAAGAEAIYQITHAFRLGELGPLHNPEFTMVEWYRVGDDLEQGMQLTDRLAQSALGRGPARRISYRDAFGEYLDLDPLVADTDELAKMAATLDIAVPESLDAGDRDGWLDLLLVERVQPQLGTAEPVLLYDYPASQAALARVRDDDPPVAERFELYVDGIELANGYCELTDADELLRRNIEANRWRRADGKTELPERSRLLAAMRSGLPSSVGVALGFDRLAMLALGAKSLAEVMPFPFDRA